MGASVSYTLLVIGLSMDPALWQAVSQWGEVALKSGSEVGLNSKHLLQLAGASYVSMGKSLNYSEKGWITSQSIPTSASATQL